MRQLPARGSWSEKCFRRPDSARGFSERCSHCIDITRPSTRRPRSAAQDEVVFLDCTKKTLILSRAAWRASRRTQRCPFKLGPPSEPVKPLQHAECPHQHAGGGLDAQGAAAPALAQRPVLERPL